MKKRKYGTTVMSNQTNNYIRDLKEKFAHFYVTTNDLILLGIQSPKDFSKLQIELKCKNNILSDIVTKVPLGLKQVPDNLELIKESTITLDDIKKEIKHYSSTDHRYYSATLSVLQNRFKFNQTDRMFGFLNTTKGQMYYDNLYKLLKKELP